MGGAVSSARGTGCVQPPLTTKGAPPSTNPISMPIPITYDENIVRPNVQNMPTTGFQDALPVSHNKEELLTNAYALLSHRITQENGEQINTSEVKISIPLMGLYLNRLLLYHEHCGMRTSEHQRSILISKVYDRLSAEKSKRNEHDPDVTIAEFFLFLNRLEEIDATA